VAQQSGQWAARNILADLDQTHRTAFHYKDKGIMAMIGRGAAVAEVGEHRHELHGTFAFAAWLGVHAMLLSGVRQRIDAFVAWGWDYFSRTRTAALLDASADHQIDWGDDEPLDQTATGGGGAGGQSGNP
jgi:NADH dehydrogenase